MVDVFDKIADAMASLDSDGFKKALNEAMEKKTPVTDILEKGLRKGLAEVGRRFEAGEYFLSELLFGADMMGEAMKTLSPQLKEQSIEKKGTIVLGTVRGDIHDIGKNIFKAFAQGSGFEVFDLGVDVDPENFVRNVVEKKPNVLGLSALLTTTIPEMKIVIDELKKARARDQVKVILGGNAVTEEYAKEIGADAAAVDAVQGTNFCKGWIRK